VEAVRAMMSGLVDVNLGAGLYKQRIAKKGFGKRGSYRTLLAYKRDEVVFFLYGFSKKERDNIGEKERRIYKNLAEFYLNLNKLQLARLVVIGEIIEVT
jgi:hypothetical protein